MTSAIEARLDRVERLLGTPLVGRALRDAGAGRRRAAAQAAARDAIAAIEARRAGGAARYLAQLSKVRAAVDALRAAAGALHAVADEDADAWREAMRLRDTSGVALAEPVAPTLPGGLDVDGLTRGLRDLEGTLDYLAIPARAKGAAR